MAPKKERKVLISWGAQHLQNEPEKETWQRLSLWVSACLTLSLRSSIQLQSRNIHFPPHFSPCCRQGPRTSQPKSARWSCSQVSLILFGRCWFRAFHHPQLPAAAEVIALPGTAMCFCLFALCASRAPASRYIMFAYKLQI